MTDDPIKRIRTLLTEQVHRARRSRNERLLLAESLGDVAKANPFISRRKLARILDLQQRVRASASTLDQNVIDDMLVHVDDYLKRELAKALSEVPTTQNKREESYMNRTHRRLRADEDESYQDEDEDESGDYVTCEACGHKQLLADEDEDETEAATGPHGITTTADDYVKAKCPTCGKNQSVVPFADGSANCAACSRPFQVRRHKEATTAAARIFERAIDLFAPPRRVERMVERGLSARQIFARTLHG